MQFLTIAGGWIVTIALTWSGVGMFRAWALRRCFLDVPNERSSHVQPTPRGGGLAVVLVTILGWLAVQYPLCKGPELKRRLVFAAPS